MTVWIQTNEKDVIVDCAPIVSKFIGQHIKNLADWMRKHGGFQYSELKVAKPEAIIRNHGASGLVARQSLINSA